MQTVNRSRESYHVGIICALATEKAAVEGMLDEKHPPLPQPSGDQNDYTYGRIGVHDVVIACLPTGVMGKVSSTAVATHMMRSFPIKIGLMVGICGGVWSDKTDIRLGDVIVSQPDREHGGVVQYDIGKMETGGFRRMGILNKPPLILLSAVQSLKAKHLQSGHELDRHVEQMLANNPPMAASFGCPGRVNDRLFEASYNHARADAYDCSRCDPKRIQPRLERLSDRPEIHYGNLASGDKVIKDGLERDRIAKQEQILGFEMEAAGLMDTFPCVVIRGVCDYADSHKNKRWQPYAAATAAAYAKELLGCVNRQGVRDLEPVSSVQFHIPFSLQGVPVTDCFVPREEEMQRLESFFSSSVTQERRSSFVVYGLGGIGKTQLCVEFARRNRNTFGAIFWLNGSSKSALLQSMSLAASRVPGLRTNAEKQSAEPSAQSQDSLVDAFRQWLSLPNNSQWLLIFDNVDRDWQSSLNDSEAFNIEDMLPSADHGNILVTSRLSRLRGPLGAYLHLGRVDDRIGKNMVEKRAGRSLQDVQSLLDKLEGLPLALVQAGAYLGGTPSMTVPIYLKLYDKTWARLMEHQDQFPLQEYNERSVLTTWKISYEHVKSISQDAAQLLDIWAFLYRGDLWCELATAGQDMLLAGPDDHYIFNIDEITFWDSINILSQYSLVTAAADEDSPSIHPVLHAWCLHNIESPEKQRQLYGIALRLVATWTDGHEDTSWQSARRLALHAKAVSGRLQHLDEECFNYEYFRIAYFLSHWESSTEVERLYLWALEGKEKALGPDHTSTLGTVNNLGLLYSDQGNLVKAEEMYVRALEGYEKALGPDYTSTLNTVNNLGLLYKSQGKLVKAEEMYVRALEGYEKALGPDHTSTLGTINNLGLLYRDQGNLVKAEEMFVQALEGKEKALGPDHTSTLDTVNNLGNLYKNQGNLVKAEEMFVRALEGKEKALGPDHTSTLGTINNLGLLYSDQGNLVKAEEMYVRALEGYEKALGPDYTSTLNTVNNLGSLYSDQGNLVKAEEMFVRALEGKEKALGPDHTSTLGTVNNLGLLYRDQGNLVKAEEMYVRALEGKEQALGPDHVNTLGTVYNLAAFRNDQGKVAEAEELYRRARKGYDRMPPDLQAMMDRLGGKLAAGEPGQASSARDATSPQNSRVTGPSTSTIQQDDIARPNKGRRRRWLDKIAGSFKH